MNTPPATVAWTRRRVRPAGPRWGAAGVLLLLGLSLAGCADEPDDAGAPTGAVGRPAATSGPPTGPDRADDEVDGCALLTDAEVTAVIGRHDGAEAGADGCVWENPDNAHSVTLSVGRPGTATGGALPAPDPILGTPEPGPDGIRFLLDEAEFAAADRLCTLRVVTSVTDDGDRPAMVRLARLVRDRVPGGPR
ncbi:hypothetical protein [Micromonospora endolithica]|uniref:DUF3558 domain-containing protein n=1 Tax=Micromonospora endolithica TaxID=230091 RepID=A0A3A9ZRN2_9ACTN|nr:hypothetical protein [Micromonospora endolithica]RKN50879.1 hypothetical protein D7223_03790 [Micromonospora endolithica]TWJ20352.1 Protein of unknown function (DUF3558) [Micromonospora endolithica]